MAWHNQLHLELKRSVFMLPFCLKFWEGLVTLRNIKMESNKVILIGNGVYINHWKLVWWW